MNAIPDVNITAADFKANPYPFYARLRAEAPVFRVILPDKRPAWLITRYDDVIAVLKDERFAKDTNNAMQRDQLDKQPWKPSMFKALDRNMLDLDGADHDRLRRLVHSAFTPRLIETMREQIETVANDLLDAVQAQGRMDLIRDYALQLPATIIAQMLGIPPQDRHKFQRWSYTALALTSVGSFSRLRAIPSLLGFVSYARRLVKERRRQPQDDLITALVKAGSENDQLSEDEIVGMIVLLLIAGHETTSNLIANGTLALLRHPDQLARLQENPSLIKPAIEELVRFESPVEMATERYAREPITIAGTTIPRGELVFAVLASANRDEQQFPNGDTLDLTRDPNRHLSFGQGIHYCLGAPLARMEGQIALNTLLRRIPDLRLSVPDDQLRWRRTLVVRGMESMPVAFTPERVLA